MTDQRFLKTAIGKLNADSEQTRYSTVKDLAALNSTDAVPFLIQAVSDSSCRIREEALKGICAFPQDVIFPRLEGLLRDHENANLRTAAMEAFPRFGNEATSYLLQLLKDRDNDVRIFSATILGEIQDPASVDDLVEALKDSNKNVRHASIESLGKIGDARAVGPLIDCLSQDLWVQYPAIIALGNIGEPSAIKHLVELLDNEMLREAVIEALGKIGDVSVIPVMSDILSQNNDPSLRNDMIASLINIQRMVKPDGKCLPGIKNALKNNELINHLLNSLKEKDLEVKKNAIITLGWLKEQKAVESLIALLDDYELEEYVVGSLVSIGDKALPELIKRLQDADPKIQVSLIRCIYWIGNIEGANACLPFLKNKNSEVRYHAMMAMSNKLDLEGVEDALLELLSDPDQEIQETLVEMLGRSHSKSLVKKLLHGLSSEDQLKKALSIRILGRLKDYQACESLQNLLEDQSDEIRSQAQKALSAIKADQLLREILTKGIRDKNFNVRKAVARCINNGSGENLEDTLLMLLKNPDPDVRLATIETLGKIGDVLCTKYLIDCFHHCEKQLRLAIIQAMGNIHNKKGADFLTGLLKEPDPDMKQIVLESLGKIKKKDLTPELITSLDDPDWCVRSAAIQTMEKIGDRRCVEHILKKLDDPEDIVKKAAIHALGSLGSKEIVDSLLPLAREKGLQNEALVAIERLGIPDIDSFYSFFKKSNTRLKCSLIDLLGRLKEPNIVDLIFRIIKEEEFFGVRRQAVKALCESKDQRVVSALHRIQKEDSIEEVRKEASHSLKKIKTRK